jgi:DNA-binding NarL/FixJ family response regulator
VPNLPAWATQVPPNGPFTKVSTCGQDSPVEAVRALPPVFPVRRRLRLRVLVVDDHSAFRRALTSALRMVKSIEVAGEAGGGVAAAQQAQALAPDLVIMDLSMPDLDGIAAMREIHQARPELPIVFLTAHADPGVEREAREAGASGFLAKGGSLEDLVIVLHEVAEAPD